MMSDIRNIVSIKVFLALTCIVLMAGCASFESLGFSFGHGLISELLLCCEF
jgi:hypothetical protein